MNVGAGTGMNGGRLRSFFIVGRRKGCGLSIWRTSIGRAARTRDCSAKAGARELWETFEHVLGVCEEEQTGLLLIAGGSVPPAAAGA